MRRSGFSLVELLVAATITLVVVLAAAQVFWMIGSTVANSRGLMEASSRLRSAQLRLQADLDGMTAWGVMPPADPARDAGYIEIIEGPGPWIELPSGEVYGQGIRPIRTDGSFDSSVGDLDDVIMFTTRSLGEPFLGRSYTGNVQSQVAEVAWFVRGTTLYRRQLLVLPLDGRRPVNQNHYNQSDVSVHLEGGQADHRTGFASRAEELVPNTLGDLTKRENRYAHQPLKFPHDAAFWWPYGLPTLQESTDPDWPLPDLPTGTPLYGPINFSIPVPPASVDYWALAPMAGVFPNYTDGPRAGEDVILTNVISFDVKVWDPIAPIFQQEILDRNGNLVSIESVLPGDPLYKQKLAAGAAPLDRGAYVDLFYTRGTGAAIETPFSGPGHPRSGLEVTDEARQPATYCTWSSHYNNDGLDQFGDGSVDDPNTPETVPPYPFKLLGLQITIRVFDPDSGQIRQVTVRRSGSR